MTKIFKIEELLAMGYTLPKVEEDDSHLALQEFESRLPEDMSESKKLGQVIGFACGYTLASRKKYTEEDMRKAITTAYKQDLDITGWDDRHFNIWADRVIKYLAPKPIAVEVEMEVERLFDLHTPQYNRTVERIKTKDNIVVIRRWIYE